MTTSADFTPEEWNAVREGPPSAGMIVATAERGGSFREAMAMAKAYTETRKQHGESELLDELVSKRPDMDHAKAHSAEELKQNGLKRIGEAVALVEAKASSAELGEYRLFVKSLAERVAAAKKEGDEPVSEAEAAALAEIEAALGVS